MRRLALALLVVALVPLAACEGDEFNIDPLLTTETFELTAPSPNSALPTALDITAIGGDIGGGRFPELEEDAGEWDLALRLRQGQLVLAPASALGLTDAQGERSRSGITQALSGRTFESVVEAPGRSAFVTDASVVLQQGAVYVVRSRIVPCGFIGGQQYAKLQATEVDVATGRVRLQVVTNERCDDPRLAEEG